MLRISSNPRSSHVFHHQAHPFDATPGPPQLMEDGAAVHRPFQASQARGVGAVQALGGLARGCWSQRWSYGYGSIPINSIFRGMNIHLPAILMFTRGTRFWHTAIWHVWHWDALELSWKRSQNHLKTIRNSEKNTILGLFEAAKLRLTIRKKQQAWRVRCMSKSPKAIRGTVAHKYSQMVILIPRDKAMGQTGCPWFVICPLKVANSQCHLCLPGENAPNCGNPVHPASLHQHGHVRTLLAFSWRTTWKRYVLLKDHLCHSFHPRHVSDGQRSGRSWQSLLSKLALLTGSGQMWCSKMPKLFVASH